MIFSASTPNISEPLIQTWPKWTLGSQRVPELDQPSSLTALRAAGVQNLATNGHQCFATGLNDSWMIQKLLKVGGSGQWIQHDETRSWACLMLFLKLPKWACLIHHRLCLHVCWKIPSIMMVSLPSRRNQSLKHDFWLWPWHVPGFPTRPRHRNPNSCSSRGSHTSSQGRIQCWRGPHALPH